MATRLKLKGWHVGTSSCRRQTGNVTSGGIVEPAMLDRAGWMIVVQKVLGISPDKAQSQAPGPGPSGSPSPTPLPLLFGETAPTAQCLSRRALIPHIFMRSTRLDVLLEGRLTVS